MIESLQIENFKCFERFKVDGLRRINLIGGRNNVGKTCLLDALFLFLARSNPWRVLGLHHRRGLRNYDPRSSEVVWGPIFRDFDLTRTIEVTTEADDLRLQLSVRLASDFSPPAPVGSEQPTSFRTDAPASLSDALELTYSDQAPGYMYIDPHGNPVLTGSRNGGKSPVGYLGPHSHPLQDEADVFGELERTEQVGPVLQFIQHIEPRLEDLAIVPIAGTPLLYGRLAGMPVKVPIVFMGEGIARMVAVRLAFSRARSGVLLIDELENGLHYSVHKSIWKAIVHVARELDCQVFVTTHSYEFVRHAHEAFADSDYAEDFRYIRLDRTEEGIVPVCYNAGVLAAAIETGLEVR